MYVVYTSLQATYGCNGGPITTFGSAYERKTIGYPPRFLAYGTLSSPDQRCNENVVVDGFHTIDFMDLYYHPITTSVTSKAGCPPYVNPRLSMPAELTDVDAAWKTCQPLFYGAFDPPRVLTSVKGPLDPLPTHGSPESKPPSTSHPAVTTSHEITPTPASAKQGSHTPTMPTPTSDTTPSNQADKQDPKEDIEQPQGLASHIIFGFLGPKTSDVSTSSESNEIAGGSIPTVGKSPGSSTLENPSLATSTPLAISAHTALPTQQAIVVSSSGLALEPQVESEGTSGFAGTSKIAAGKTAKTIVQQTQSPVENTLYVSTTQVHTLAVDAAMTIEGSLTTNTGSSAVTLSVLTSVAIATPVAIHSPLEDPKEDTGRVVYSLNVETYTFQPHETFTKDEGISVNTAPTAVIVTQTSSIPLAYSSLDNPRQDVGHVIYTIDVKTNTIQPDQVVTGEMGTFTNTALTAIVLTQTSSIPLAYSSLQDSQQDVDRVIFSIDAETNTLQPNQVATHNGELVTNTASTAMVVTQTSSIPLATIANSLQDVNRVIYSIAVVTNPVQPNHVATNNGEVFTNTAPTAMLVTQTSSIPLVTIADSRQDVDRLVYSIAVVTNTLQPNQVATNNGQAFTNTASTAMVFTQTSSIPLVAIDKPTHKVLSTLYETSIITSSISPGAVFTVSGSRTTNTANSALVLTSMVQVPTSTATLFPADIPGLGLISNVNSQPATQVISVDEFSEKHTATGAPSEHFTLVFADGKNRSTVTRVRTDQAYQVSQSTAKIRSSHSEDTALANLSTTVTSAGGAQSTAALVSSTQIQVPDNSNGTSRTNMNGGLARLLIAIGGFIWIFLL